jgi:sulfur-carrier protein
MASVRFTGNLQRHVDAPPSDAPGQTVRQVLESVFNNNPRLRGYVLDERGELRKHMVVFVNGEPVVDRVGLSDPVADSSEVYVMQAISGG